MQKQVIYMMQKFKAWLFRVMTGRYGMDQLNAAMMVASAVTALLSMVTRSFVLLVVTYVLLGYAVFRAMSRQQYQRYQENRRYLMMLDRFRDRKNRYYKCPKCRQMVRVPRGKGKISITCPKCGTKFIKKT